MTNRDFDTCFRHRLMQKCFYRINRMTQHSFRRKERKSFSHFIQCKENLFSELWKKMSTNMTEEGMLTFFSWLYFSSEWMEQNSCEFSENYECTCQSFHVCYTWREAFHCNSYEVIRLLCKKAIEPKLCCTPFWLTRRSAEIGETSLLRKESTKLDLI